MRIINIFIILILITSCSQKTNKDIIRGYSESDYLKISKQALGKKSTQIIKLLGHPVIEGECKSCVKGGLYRMIYPTKNMQRFYVEISYNTDVELDCTVLDLYPAGKKKGVYVFKKGTKIKKYLRCNQADGVIMKLKNQE